MPLLLVEGLLEVGATFLLVLETRLQQLDWTQGDAAAELGLLLLLNLLLDDALLARNVL